MPHPNAYEDAARIFAGDVVHAEGASAILGDVLEVSEEGVKVAWRATTTTEQPDDLTIELQQLPGFIPAPTVATPSEPGWVEPGGFLGSEVNLNKTRALDVIGDVSATPNGANVAVRILRSAGENIYQQHGYVLLTNREAMALARQLEQVARA